MGERAYWCTMLGLAVGYSALAALLLPLDDELYYWCWAQTPQLSYFDHAPLSGYFVALSTGFLGDSVFAIRLPAVLSSLVVVGILGRLMQPRALWGWVVLTPLFTFGAVFLTPDTPLLLFWALYLAWLVAVHRRLDGAPGGVSAWLWLLGGVLLGCGALGKYTMALAVPAGFLSFLMADARGFRRWLPGYLGHGVVSFLLFIPVIVFNYQRDFEPIRFQWAHAMASESRWWKTFPEFVGIQWLLFGMLPLTLLPWVLSNFRALCREPRLRVCACLYALPFAFFLYKSLRGPLEGNWALAAYLGFWPLAAHWLATACPPRWRDLAKVSSFAPPYLVVLVATVHLIRPIHWVTPAKDRISRQAPRLEAARLGAEAVRRDGRPIPVFTPTYQMTAILRYYGVDARQMAGVSRPSHFTTPPDIFADAQEAYVWNEMLLPPELAPGFAEPTLIGSFPVVVQGEEVSGYHLLYYHKLTPPAPR